MNIVVAGGTGFIGTYLIRELVHRGNNVVVLTRSQMPGRSPHSASVRFVHWDAATFGEWCEEINGADVVINAAGKNIFERRWNDRIKNDILRSRVHSTELIVEAIAQSVTKPTLLISFSAIGYYGETGDTTVTETSPRGNDFLSDVVHQWEQTARRAERYGVRVANPRLGLVLQKDGGILRQLLLPFRLFAGGWIGSGKQFAPWIHMNDAIRAVLYPIENENISGPYIAASPNPVTMKVFCSALGTVLHRPSWIPVPDIALQILFGEGAPVIVSGQRAVPEKLLDAGFHFEYTDLSAAFHTILS